MLFFGQVTKLIYIVVPTFEPFTHWNSFSCSGIQVVIVIWHLNQKLIMHFYKTVNAITHG